MLCQVFAWVQEKRWLLPRLETVLGHIASKEAVSAQGFRVPWEAMPSNALCILRILVGYCPPSLTVG